MRTALLRIAIVASLALATPALADTIFSSGAMFSGPTAVNSICLIFNAGTKPAKIVSVGIPPFNTSVGTGSTTGDTCTSAPLAPDATCAFGGSYGVYGGGVAHVKGSAKKLRGNCTIYSVATGLPIFSEPMR